MPERNLAASLPLGMFRRTELVESIAEHLREEILNGRFGADGELPVEAELTKTYGVSRTVTREAMRSLRSLGLVEVQQGRRPRVKPADPRIASASLELLIRRGSSSLLELTEIRRPIEAEIAALAAARWQDESQITALQQHIDEQSAAVDLADQIVADNAFHRDLAEMTGNSLFPLLLASIHPLLIESRTLTITHVGVGRAIAGHTAILDAVRRRDVEGARSAMLRHMDMAKDDLSEIQMHEKPAD